MTSSRRTMMVLVLILLLAGGYLLRTMHRPAPGTDPFHARVVSVFDGDTLRVRTPTGVHRVVRLENVECPEVRPNDNCRRDARRGGWDCVRQAKLGREARRFVRDRLVETSVRVIPRSPESSGEDRRLIGRVQTTAGRDLGEALLEAKLCRPWLDTPPTGAEPPF